MKVIVFCIGLFFYLTAFAQEYTFRNDLTTAQKEYLNSLSEPWGTSEESASKAFAPIRKLILEDEFTKRIYGQVEKKLKTLGINRIEDFIGFCEDMNDGTSGGFTENVQLLINLLVLPGQQVHWATSVLEQKKEAFRSEEVDIPFFKILFTADKPTVCVSREESIISAHGVFIHEFVHFLKTDSIKNHTLLLTMTNYNEYINHNLYNSGGEIEAYRVGVKAEIRLLKKLGVTNPSLNYKFANDSGEIVSDMELEKYVKDLYMPYYNQVQSSLTTYANSFNSARIWYLENAMSQYRDLYPTWLLGVDDEIKKIRAIKLD